MSRQVRRQACARVRLCVSVLCCIWLAAMTLGSEPVVSDAHGADGAASAKRVAASTSDLGDITRDSLVELQVATSVSKRFLSVGRDPVANLDLVRWAEYVAGKLVNGFGLALAYSGYPVVRIGVLSAGADERVLVSSVREKGQLVQRLEILDYGSADQGEALEGLCRLLLNYEIGCVAGHTTASARVESDGGRHRIPLWMSHGLARCLKESLVQDDQDLMLGLWESGQAGSLVSLLNADADGAGAWDPAAHSAYGTDRVRLARASLALRFLEERSEGRGCLPALLGVLAAGGKLDGACVAQVVSGLASAGDLEDSWDAWLVRQRRVILKPGGVGPALLSRFRACLLISLADCGLNQVADPHAVVPLKDLTSMEVTEMLKRSLARRCEELCLMSVGRGAEVGAAAEKYCQFFQAVSGSDSAGAKLALSEAEAALAGLESIVATSLREVGDQ